MSQDRDYRDDLREAIGAVVTNYHASQGAIATLAGVSPGVLGRVLRKRAHFSVAHLSRVCYVIGIQVRMAPMKKELPFKKRI